MKKSLLIVLALGAWLLGGCAHREEQHGRQLPPLEVRSKPQVSVTGRTINVPLVLYFFSTEKNVRITWELSKDSPYHFPSNGIVIEGALTERVIRTSGDGATAAVPLDTRQTEVSCDRQGGGKQFSCRNLNSRPGIYKYTIRVVDDKGNALERDPFVMNDL